MVENCGNCVYFVDQACHRHAPQQVFGSGTGFANWEWMKPPKGKDDWCGDHCSWVSLYVRGGPR